MTSFLYHPNDLESCQSGHVDSGHCKRHVDFYLPFYCLIWSITRYVLLQFWHLREDNQLLIQREKALKGATALEDNEKVEIQRRRSAIWNEIWVNLGYLPLTVHWWGSISAFCDVVSSYRAGLWRVDCTRMRWACRGIQIAAFSDITAVLDWRVWVISGLVQFQRGMASHRTECWAVICLSSHDQALLL